MRRAAVLFAAASIACAAAGETVLFDFETEAEQKAIVKADRSKAFHVADERLVCPNMKKTTLENLAESLREMVHPVEVAPDVAVRAKRAIDAMLAIG